MERNSKNVKLARCPHCNALCVNGHDDDHQIFCAKCGKTFLPKSYTELNGEEFGEMEQQAIRRYSRNGWIAYKTSVKLASCPHCKALCVNEDDTYHEIFCARCGKTFLPESYKEMTAEEFIELGKNAYSKHMRNGWVAYVT